MFIFNRQAVRNQRHKVYEKLAKPGRKSSVYSNKHYLGEILLEEYRVEQIFQDKSSGFYALGLEAITRKNPPALVIRGCGNWGTFKDFPKEFLPYQDIPDVIMSKSNEHFQSAKKSGAIQWLQNQTATGKKPDIVGQSLGGKVGQQLTIEVPKYIHSLVTFNSIGISSEEFDRYKGKVKIFHYINPDDLFSYIFGDKFLPGTIFQVYNPTILKPDLMNQHNQLVLEDPATQIKEVKSEKFFKERTLYQLFEKYTKLIQKNLEELQQNAHQKPDKEGEDGLSPQIREKFETSQQIIQQKFREISQAIRQERRKYDQSKDFKQSFQKQVENSVEFIQKEMETLIQTIQQEDETSSTSNGHNNLTDFFKAMQKNIEKFWEK